MKFNLPAFLFGFCVGLIVIILLLMTDSKRAFGYEWEDEQAQQEYRDNRIERWNEKVKIEKSQWQINNEQTVREINRQNLYINSKDYRDETIIIERKGYSND